MVDASEIVGITTNPTIFAKAIGAGSGYEAQLRDLALRGTAIGETLRLVTAWDVRAACDIMRLVYDRTGKRDGRVSIEVDPRISGDADRTAAEARGYGGWSIGPTCPSRFPRRLRVYRRSRPVWPIGSASTLPSFSRLTGIGQFSTLFLQDWSSAWRPAAVLSASKVSHPSSSAALTPR